MKLNQLTDENYSRQKRIRVGRGIGSGKGKTCGAGHKGQKSRSGVSIHGFEGGQMPIYRRLPKRGFVNVGRVSFQSINIGDLQRYIDSKSLDASKAIDLNTLIEAGVFKKNKKLKLLAKGEIKSAIKITVDAASKSAIEAVKKAGGTVTIAEPKEVKAA